MSNFGGSPNFPRQHAIEVRHLFERQVIRVFRVDLVSGFVPVCRCLWYSLSDATSRELVVRSVLDLATNVSGAWFILAIVAFSLLMRHSVFWFGCVR